MAVMGLLGFTRAGRPDEEDEEIGVEAVGLELGPNAALDGCAHGVDGGPPAEDFGRRQVFGVLKVEFD